MTTGLLLVADHLHLLMRGERRLEAMSYRNKIGTPLCKRSSVRSLSRLIKGSRSTSKMQSSKLRGMMPEVSARAVLTKSFVRICNGFRRYSRALPR